MEVLAIIYGNMSMACLVFGLGLIVLGQQLDTWDNSDKVWKQKLASLGFNYLMPTGILVMVVLVPLILLLGVATFGLMFALL